MTTQHTDVGKRLKELREEKNLSQDDIATASGISQATISRIEANTQTPTTGTLETIVLAMDSSLSEFFKK